MENRTQFYSALPWNLVVIQVFPMNNNIPDISTWQQWAQLQCFKCFFLAYMNLKTYFLLGDKLFGEELPLFPLL